MTSASCAPAAAELNGGSPPAPRGYSGAVAALILDNPRCRNARPGGEAADGVAWLSYVANQTPDTARAGRAFPQKREPVFRGR